MITGKNYVELKSSKTNKVKFPPARQEKLKKVIAELAMNGITFDIKNDQLFLVNEEGNQTAFAYMTKVIEFENELAEIVNRVSLLLSVGWEANIMVFSYTKQISEDSYVVLEQSDYVNELDLFTVSKDAKGKEIKKWVARGESWFMVMSAEMISNKLMEREQFKVIG